jgi:hypothetical protein
LTAAQPKRTLQGETFWPNGRTLRSSEFVRALTWPREPEDSQRNHGVARIAGGPPSLIEGRVSGAAKGGDVRYRDDAQRKKRFKTVELLVAERDWEPPRPRFAPDQIVGLRVAFADMAVRDRVKQAGATWNPERRVWRLRYDRVVALGLNSRIVDEPASNTGCPGSSRENLHADAQAPSR